MPLPNSDLEQTGGFPAHVVAKNVPAATPETPLQQAEADVAKAEAEVKQAEEAKTPVNLTNAAQVVTPTNPS